MEMKDRVRSPLYATLRPYVKAAGLLFYRRWIVLGLKNFPGRGRPVILVSNHQNALMDPLVCCLTAPRQLHFLTRADVFRNKAFRKFVLDLNMLPVYRQRDRMTDMVERNNKSFSVAINRLSKGAVIGIFPEGNHGDRKLLRPLKKGITILLHQAAEGEHQLTDIDIVPVAVDYDHYRRSRSRLVVSYGEAFSLEEELFGNPSKPLQKRQQEALDAVHRRLSAEMLDLGPESHYELLRFTEAVAFDREGYNDWRSTRDRIHRFRDEITANNRQIEPPAKEATLLSEEMAARGIDHSHWLKMKRGPTGGRLLTLLLMIPALPGFLFFFTPWQITQGLVRKLLRDPLFSSTFKMTFGMVLLPLFWLIIGGISFIFLPWKWALGGMLAVALSGLIALPVSDRFIDHGIAARGRQFEKKHKEVYERWVNLRHKLLTALYE